MSKIRIRLDELFSFLAAFFYDHRLKVITAVLLLFGALFMQLNDLRMDTSVESFFHQTDRSLVEYMAFKEQFGRDDYVVVGIKSPTVFDLDVLKRLQSLHFELEEKVPHLYQVDSLINIRHTQGENDTLVIEELLEDWPESKEDLDELKQKLLFNPLYLNSIINETGTVTAILLESELLTHSSRENDEMLSFQSTDSATTATNQLTEAERSQFVSAIQSIARRYEKEDFKVFITGAPVLAHELRVTLVKENQLFISLALVMLVSFLFILFRRFSGVFIPLCLVVLTTLTTFSMMSIMGLPFTLVTQILPIFILVVGIGDTVHILALFFRHFNQYGDKRTAIIYAMEHSGLAILMTSVTTAAGLLSFASAEMATVAQLGLTGSMGVLVAFILTIVLCPVFISMIPLKTKQKTKKNSNQDRLEQFLGSVAGISIRHRPAIFVVSILILVFSVIGISKLRFAHNDLDAFSHSGSFYKDSKLLDQELKGSVVMEVVLETEKENGLHDPAFLKKLEESEILIEAMAFGELFVGKTISITSIVKETHKALHNNQHEYYKIPDNRKVIAQELLLFENGGAEDLEKVTDSVFSKARLTIKAPFADSWDYVALIDATRDLLMKRFPELKITITGLLMLFAQVLKKVIVSMTESYMIVFSVVTLLMILMIGKVRIGLASMLPNILPILLILGCMGWAGLPLDFFNITLGSIAVGIAVDDTIHFFHNFRRYFEISGDAEQAVIQTFQTTGRALLTTTIVLCCGFYIYCFSELKVMYVYGFLMGSTILFALLADFLLAPALLISLNRTSQKTDTQRVIARGH